MHEKDSQYTAEFHKLYVNAKKLVDDDILDISNKINNLNDSEEKDFYFAVMAHFLQKRQKEVINKGLF
jgi:hypothetical protein